jgi:hypothetical protein
VISAPIISLERAFDRCRAGGSVGGAIWCYPNFRSSGGAFVVCQRVRVRSRHYILAIIRGICPPRRVRAVRVRVGPGAWIETCPAARHIGCAFLGPTRRPKAGQYRCSGCGRVHRGSSGDSNPTRPGAAIVPEFSRGRRQGSKPGCEPGRDRIADARWDAGTTRFCGSGTPLPRVNPAQGGSRHYTAIPQHAHEQSTTYSINDPQY